MAGYSGTPLIRKLGIREDHRVLLKNEPAELPEDLKEYVGTRSRKNLNLKNLDVVLFFVQSAAALNTGLEPLLKRINADGMIWIAWPKKASGIKTDVTENLIRDRALETPLVDIKVCAIDETWSGLKFVIRKEHRAAFAPAASNDAN